MICIGQVFQTFPAPAAVILKSALLPIRASLLCIYFISWAVFFPSCWLGDEDGGGVPFLPEDIAESSGVGRDARLLQGTFLVTRFENPALNVK